MKKYVSIIALFFAGIVFVYAQEARQTKRVSQIMANIQKACNLSNEQASKVLPVVQFFVKTSFDNRKQYANDKAELKTARTTNKENFKEGLAKVLSPDQMKQLEQYTKDKRAKRGGNQSNDENEGE